MAYMMRFMTSVERRDVAQVQHQLLGGYANANSNYLGVFPLHLAIEHGDVDMYLVLGPSVIEVVQKLS